MEGKNLAKKIAMALLCTAALPAASQAAQDAEFQTFLAKGGCGGEEDSSSSNKGSCGAASNQKKSHACGAATNSHACGAATNSHACGAATNSHACGAQTNQNNQAGSATYNSNGTRNRNQQYQTTYTGASTLPGPNDGYPSTPREKSYSDYPKNENTNSRNYDMNQR